MGPRIVARGPRAAPSPGPLALVGLLALVTSLAAAPGLAAAQGPAAPTPRGAERVAGVSSKTVVLPTVLREGDGARAPGASDGELLGAARALDALLTETAQDLGLSVDLAPRSAKDAARLGEPELVERARALDGILLVPSLRVAPGGGPLELRLALASAGARALRVRSERVAREDIPVRAVIMLRDLVADLEVPRPAPAASSPPELSPVPQLGRPSAASPPGVLTARARSAGKATLFVNATLYGGLVGFSVQRSSGSDDPRLLYPLLAVGAGIGLGASAIIAEEWDVGVGDAWFLSSGAWWPTLAGHLIYAGRFGTAGSTGAGDEWSYGLIGGTAGLTLATLGLTLHGMGEGGAFLAHSGGGLGFVFGGLAELAVRGDIHTTPFAGAGYGAGIGWLAAAAVATQVDVPPSRVLIVDLGVLVGSLGGAALGSPLLIHTPTPGQQRGWLAATAGGGLLGAGVALYLTRDARAPASARQATGLLHGSPVLGPIGESQVGSRQSPALGVGWRAILD